MKNFLLFASAFIMMATISCNNTTTTNSAVTSNIQKSTDDSFSGVVYINTDSLIQGYKMFIDLNNEFTIKAEKIEREINIRASKFDNDLKTFQSRIEKGLLTRTEAQQRQVELENEQKVLIQYRDSKLQEVREEEIVIMNKISDKIQTTINKYNEQKKYKMIINTSASMKVILAGDPSLDVTQEVLDILNSEYTPSI